MSVRGWQYALDFPRTFSGRRDKTSCVRRRLWSRYYRFDGYDHWIKIPGLSEDPTQEPFQDISVGGTSIPGHDSGYLAVWAVTFQGKVVYRSGISEKCPEGEEWLEIPSPQVSITQLSVSQTGVVWGVTWEGVAVVRTGVTYYQHTAATLQDPNCTSLFESEKHDRHQAGGVTVENEIGGSVVKTNENATCFRGYRQLAYTLYWLSNQNDYQVISKTVEDTLGFNSIAVEDKRGSLLVLRNSMGSCFCSSHVKRIRPASGFCWFKQCLGSNKGWPEVAHLSNKTSQAVIMATKDMYTGHGIPEKVWFRKGVSRTNDQKENSVTGIKWVEMVGKFSLLSVGLNDQVFALSCLGDHLYFRSDVTSQELVGKTWKIVHFDRTKIRGRNYSCFSSEGSPGELCRDSLSESDDSVGHLHTSSSLPCNIPFLTWFSSGSCDVDWSFFTDISGNLLTAASSLSLTSLSNRDAVWRKVLLQKLRTRDKTEFCCDELYEEAVSQGDWCKRGYFQILLDPNSNLWFDCFVKLDQGGGHKNGALLIYHETRSAHEEMCILFCDIKCVCIVHKMSRNHCFAIHTSAIGHERNPLVINAGSEKELHDWVTTVSIAVSVVHKCEGGASPNAIWATSLWGDVFFCEIPVLESEIQPPQLFWRQVGGHMSKVESGAAGVVWGLSFDSVPYCYSGGYGGGIFTTLAGSSDRIHQQEDYEWHYVYENQRWNPLDGFSERRLPSDRRNWSDENGVYELSREGYILPSSQWQWADEQWLIDTNPNITDKDGWQYAVDFPRSYHRERGWHDYVRRRRWKRRSKLITTGPWILVPPQVRLLDMSIEMDKHVGLVGVWTVGTKGDVLYRHGVTRECPQGTAWEHILTDLPFISISVGCKQRVWGIAENGTAYFRAGFGENSITGTCWYREAITESYPEGTSWRCQPFSVTSLSIGAMNQVWMVKRNSIQRRCGVTPYDPQGREWQVIVSDCWRCVSIRSLPEVEDGLVDEAEDVVKEDPVVLASSLMTKLDLSTLDIYSSYKQDEET
ncbi:Tectonin beta-propeller repeat-containing protein 1 [Acropora cervicornis]|uniref:Tectonin beta-propeller repeat-containing protein 1 n=1 Tax=Acropora cervicornis TaxID=6130 RepID=A0AAD9V984_ACRCE|nr:Tectonin beta-propeller repeat-containing protein 1 [Acropora cervicornis]